MAYYTKQLVLNTNFTVTDYIKECKLWKLILKLRIFF